MPLVGAREVDVSAQALSFNTVSAHDLDIIVVPAIRTSLDQLKSTTLHRNGLFSFYNRVVHASVHIFDFEGEASWTAKDCLDQYATAVLQYTITMKEQHPGRAAAIHFVGHSTGGLVVKKALVLAQRSARFATLWPLCRTVAFFGVPHQGSTVLSDESFGQSIAETLNLKESMPPELCQILAPGSDVLRILAYDFAVVARKIEKIFTFTESEDTAIRAFAASPTEGDTELVLQFPIVDARSAILHYGNETVYSMELTHNNLLDLELFLNRLTSHLNALNAEGYLQSLRSLVHDLHTAPDDLDNEIRLSLLTDVHLFYRSSKDTLKPTVKPWSVYEPLKVLLKDGPNKCLRRPLQMKTPSPAVTPSHLTSSRVRDGVGEGRRPSIANLDTLLSHDSDVSQIEIPLIRIRPPTPPLRENRKSSAAEAGSGVLQNQPNYHDTDGGQESKDQPLIKLNPHVAVRDTAQEDEIEGWKYYQERLKRDGAIRRIPDASDWLFRWIHIPCNVLSFVPEVMQCLTLDTESLHFHDTILLKDYFDAKQSIARHGKSHSRCMKPGSTSFVNTTDDANRPHGSALSPGQLSVFLPYLHWDSFQLLMKRNDLLSTRAAQRYAHPVRQEVRSGKSMEQKLIWQYSGDNGTLPLHHRRSLDQFGYPNLRSTQVRDQDQVLHKRRKYARTAFPADLNIGPDTRVTLSEDTRSKDKSQIRQESNYKSIPLKVCDGKVLMVDQLWCWMTDASTVLTFFTPKESEHADKSVSKRVAKLADLRNSIYNDVNGDPRFATQCHSALDFVALVVYHAITVFLEDMEHEDLQVFRIFEEYISILTELHTESFKTFRDRYNVRGTASEGNTLGRMRSEALTRQQTADLRANENDLTALLELRDIEDELTTLDKLFRDQTRVLQQLIQDFGKLRPDGTQGIEKLREALEKVGNYRDLVQDMQSNCKSAQEAFTRLLDLKQKQASVIEAWAAREANEVASGQSRAVMIFTVFTIIFLPLSFFTSLFGMNARAWSGVKTNLTLHVILLWMFPVSAAVTIFALLAAFNDIFRAQLARITQKVIRWSPWTDREDDLEKGLAQRQRTPSVSTAIQVASLPAAVMATDLRPFARPAGKTSWKLE